MGADPLTIGALAVSAIGTATQAYGQWQQGQDARATSDANAALAGTLARDARMRGEEVVQDIRREGRSAEEAQRTAWGTSGLALEGTPLEVMGESRYMAELDATRARRNAAREAWGYEVQAQQMRRAGSSAELAGALGALGTGLQGATSTLLGGNDLRRRYGWKG